MIHTSPSSTPLRLTVNGSRLLDPTTGQPTRLTGFNWQIGRTGPDPGRLQVNLAPKSNLARLVGVQWGNTHPLQTHPNKECMTHTPPHFFNDKCFEDLDPWVRSATDAGLWVVLAVRGEYVAGQLYASEPGTVVFRNATLATMLAGMWRHVAAHYANVSRIAAYEILAEPRDKEASADAVRAVYEQGCAAAHAADPRTPCLVGGAPYYKLWTFGAHTLLRNSSNVIYTFDYFEPDMYVFGRAGAGAGGGGTAGGGVEAAGSVAAGAAGGAAGVEWGGAAAALTRADAPPIGVYNASYPCSTLYDGWVEAACPSWNLSSSAAPIRFDRAWHEHNLRVFAASVRAAHNVPLFLNQFEVVHGVTAGAGRYAYIADLLAVAQQLDIGWAWWTWEGGNSDGWSHGSSEVVFRWPNGTTMVDSAVLDAMEPYFA